MSSTHRLIFKLTFSRYSISSSKECREKMVTTPSAALFALLLSFAAYLTYRRLARHSVKHIRGPKGSFFLG